MLIAVAVAVALPLWLNHRHRGQALESLRVFAVAHGGRPCEGGADLAWRGVAVALRLVPGGPTDESRVEVSARGPVPALRALRRHGWERAALPDLARGLMRVPVVARDAHGVLRTDDVALYESLGDVRDGWAVITAAHADAILACDGGRALVAVIGAIDRRAVWEAACRVVVALASCDGGLRAALEALPDATPSGDGDVAVRLAPDGLLVAVRDGVLFAELAVAGAPSPPDLSRAGNGDLTLAHGLARFTWLRVERDPARLLAAVELLRTLAPRDAPYR